MKFTLGWLREHLDTKADIKVIESTLTNIGLEVESIEDRADELKPFTVAKIINVSKIITEADKNGKKTIIFGNGGSAAIASHFSVDLTKNARVRCVNFNEPDLLTCFSNDFGYEKWVEKSIEYYGDEGDAVILISAGGNSPNMINGAKKAKEKKFSKVIILTGNDKNNKLSGKKKRS